MAPPPVTTETRKIVVLGAANVGKSSLIRKLLDDQFDEAYRPTISDRFEKTLHWRGKDYPCIIYDTGGQDEFSPIKPEHAVGIHGYVLAYAISSQKSFDAVSIIYDKIVHFCGVPMPTVIVGTKSDLFMSRQVSEVDGKNLAEEKESAWVEVSARDGSYESIANVFKLCIEEYEIRNHPASPPQSPLEKDRNCVLM
ncbi:hypothetical protein HMN09_00387500 [Mycena chlorophos]|uniref:P-loop containing nucleoside triphosphate hydrolase protein n=1 Tax=Mycena chlorophos TaxID=658473 RepID=A0A8H6WID6_MYCCL|nr:hypothetical protein HMN09_00387500 [Mycena chlorophos]